MPTIMKTKKITDKNMKFFVYTKLQCNNLYHLSQSILKAKKSLMRYTKSNINDDDDGDDDDDDDEEEEEEEEEEQDCQQGDYGCDCDIVGGDGGDDDDEEEEEDIVRGLSGACLTQF